MEAPAETPRIPDVVVSGPSSDGLAEQASSQAEGAAVADAVNSATGSTTQPTIEDVSATGADVPTVPPSSSSWWSYLGWDTSTSATQINEELKAELSSPVLEDVKKDAEPLESASAVSPAGAAERGLISPSPSKDTSTSPVIQEPSNAEQPSPSDKQQTPSLFSAETSKSQSSAWYSPWSWYAASPIVPSSSSALAGTPQPQSSDSIAEGTHQKTESEIVKEEALARAADTPDDSPTPKADAASLASGDQPLDPTASPSVNPIESSIANNRSGWASFFMSKALLVKTITDGQESKSQDQNGMEVMDIDEDEDEGGQSSEEPAPAPPVVTASKAMQIVAGKPTDRLRSTPQSASASVSASPNTREPVPPPKEREPKKSGPPIPPLTNSDSIKKETAKVVSVETRSPSPTPSKASGTSPRLSPPNLVLPTWKDTFLSPPRSLMPPPPTPPVPQKSTIGKTLDFFSGVLFAGNEDDGKGTVKSKGKERENDMQYTHFGMDLPKALDVTGQMFDPNVLNARCRVVVIGVAGWSPGASAKQMWMNLMKADRCC